MTKCQNAKRQDFQQARAGSFAWSAAEAENCRAGNPAATLGQNEVVV